jgi:deoxyribodipyrimidine photolyase-related protein
MSKEPKPEKTAKLIFPHQLFEHNPLFETDGIFFLIEEPLFFKHFKFHRQKLVFHRATMRFYEDFLSRLGRNVEYIEVNSAISDVRQLIPELLERGFNRFECNDLVDDWLRRRIRRTLGQLAELSELDSPGFLNKQTEIREYFEGRKRFLQADFYTKQRKKRGVLLDEEGQPIGGKWSFDEENRKKYPKSATPPAVNFPPENDFFSEAIVYVKENFSDHPGEINANFRYPTTFNESRQWLGEFLETRFEDFGAYEDAIVSEEQILNHSLLSPLLNSGLLAVEETLQEILDFASKRSVSINSTEGLVRQVIGWREFIRGLYESVGRRERTTNFWGFTRPIPASFWTGSTGIVPIDTTIKKILKTGYCHHIERLMILGNFMVLCEFDPDEVYRWFMEMFIDSYDWVMVPNVYGMSQFADGGLMSTKPYISGSNYLMKMGDFPKGDWQEIWDALFWRFLSENRDFFSKNPRLSMLLRTFDRFSDEKREKLLGTANAYLSRLDA